MEKESYRKLFWATGLPEAWLLCRWAEERAEPAMEQREHGGTLV